MSGISKFDGKAMSIENAILIDEDFFQRLIKENERLKIRIRELEDVAKQPVRGTGTVAGKEGRKPVLTEEEKERIKYLYSQSHSLRSLAHVYEVSHETIRSVVLENGEERFCLNCAEETKWIREQKGSHLFCSKCGVNENRHQRAEKDDKPPSRVGKSNIFQKPKTMISDDFDVRD